MGSSYSFGGSSGNGADLAAHEADTSAVHGIPDTALLETTAGAQAKVNTHEADTAGVHGITDTSGLALKPYVRQAYITTGVVNPPNTSGAWQVLQQAASAGPFELAIPAAAGDHVEVTMQTWWTHKSTISIDLGVVVGSSIVRYLSTGSGTPSSRGLPWAHQDAAFKTPSSPVGFTVASGDLDGGNVRFSVVVKSDGTAADFYATSTFPFYWRALNRRSVL